jgi:hypothetical protein
LHSIDKAWRRIDEALECIAEYCKALKSIGKHRKALKSIDKAFTNKVSGIV